MKKLLLLLTLAITLSCTIESIQAPAEVQEIESRVLIKIIELKEGMSFPLEATPPSEWYATQRIPAPSGTYYEYQLGDGSCNCIIETVEYIANTAYVTFYESFCGCGYYGVEYTASGMSDFYECPCYD